MRVRLQLLLPLVVGLLMAAGFFLVAYTVGDAVRGALVTVPGITRERAAEEAGRAVVLAGILATFLAVVAAAIIARMIVRPLLAVQAAAERLDAGAGEMEIPAPATPVAEIRDAAKGLSRAAADFRHRHQQAVRESAELAALLEAVSEGILHVDALGRIVRANRASLALLGLRADAAGRPLGGLLRNASLRRIFLRAGAEGPGLSTTEVVLDDRRILVTISPQGGGGFVATLVDLTDLRRLEEVRRDFVANASHELKTPLTSIRGYSETLLADDLPEAERRQFLTTIARNAQRLQRIVDDLLDLSRLEAGRWRPDLEPLDPLRAARAAWETAADEGAGKAVSFTDHSEGESRVLADRGGLDQIFSNLFDNALRYSRAGGQIRVTARPDSEGPERAPPPLTDAHGSVRTGGTGGGIGGGTKGGTKGGAGPWVLIEVSDTGAGIPRDALPRIFERFYRVDPARSRSEGGTGLGLSIVKHLMESMGGHVRADSTLGKGTTIRLWLPAAAAPTDSGYADVTEP